jgi:hypothetical protein
MIFPEIPRSPSGLTIFLHLQRSSRARSGQRLAMGVSGPNCWQSPLRPSPPQLNNSLSNPALGIIDRCITGTAV